MQVDEILVHISASVSNDDDKKYRQLVKTLYLFKACQKTLVSRADPHGNEQDGPFLLSHSMHVPQIDPHLFSPPGGESVSAEPEQIEIPASENFIRGRKELAVESFQRSAKQSSAVIVEETPRHSGCSSSPTVVALLRDCDSPISSNSYSESDSNEQAFPAFNTDKGSAAIASGQREGNPDPGFIVEPENTWEINPPCPRVSSSRGPKSHMTAFLARLASRMRLNENYRPSYQRRDLRPLERGYWAFETRWWSSARQKSFRRSLSKYVGSGKAGWGISCLLMGTNDQISCCRRQVPRRSQLERARIYCWGEVAGHIYLLALLASRCEIRKGKASWIDADESIVVQMG